MLVPSSRCSLAISIRVCTRSADNPDWTGFVEQENAWLAHDGLADGDPLALAAGQLFRQSFQQVFDFARGSPPGAPDARSQADPAWPIFKPNAMLSKTDMCGYRA